MGGISYTDFLSPDNVSYATLPNLRHSKVDSRHFLFTVYRFDDYNNLKYA